MRGRCLLFGLLLCSACASIDDDDTAVDDDDATDPPASTGEVRLGDPVPCDAPTAGLDRWSEEAEERGISLLYSPVEEITACPMIPAAVVARDLDGDGDVDLSFGRADGFPHLYENDGSGHFTEVDAAPSLSGSDGRFASAHAVVDLDGDGLPEIVFVHTPGPLLLFRNLGAMRFSDAEVLWQPGPYPRACRVSLVFGDVDADGDLDVVLPGLDPVPTEDWVQPEILPGEGTPSLLLLNPGGPGPWPVGAELIPGPVAGLSLGGIFTDRDLDGDLDLLLGADRPFGHPPQPFFRNDGDLRLVNDAPELGAALPISAMGFCEADINRDGRPDYCFTDDRVYCLESDGGGYFEGGLARGLDTGSPGAPSADGIPWIWSGWGMELEDFDNDGALDLWAVGSPPPPIISDPSHPFAFPWPEQSDQFWRGRADGGFDYVGDALGLDDPAPHYTIAAADFDRDGALDVIIGPYAGRPKLHMNRCTEGAWLQVDLSGPPSNRDGYGARVEVTAGGRTELRELHTTRVAGQAPALLHFGLGGEESVERLEVMWPDGSRTATEGVPARRRVEVRHADAP